MNVALCTLFCARCRIHAQPGGRGSRGSRVRRLAGQPGGTALVQPLHLGAAHARHVGLDRIADPDLQVGQVPVALGEAGEQLRVQDERGARIDGIDPVFLVDGLAEHHPPAPVPFLHEIVEPAQAVHVAQHAVDLGSLHDRHPGLRDGPRPVQGDPAAAGEVQDVHAAGDAFLANPDEVVLRPLEPGGHHVAVIVPAGPEGVPVSGVPGAGPGLDDIADGKAIGKQGVHPAHAIAWGVAGTNPVRHKCPSPGDHGAMTASGEFDARPVRAFLPGPGLRVDESAWPARCTAAVSG